MCIRDRSITSHAVDNHILWKSFYTVYHKIAVIIQRKKLKWLFNIHISQWCAPVSYTHLCTQVDKSTALILAEIAQIDVEEFAQKMFEDVYKRQTLLRKYLSWDTTMTVFSKLMRNSSRHEMASRSQWLDVYKRQDKGVSVRR